MFLLLRIYKNMSRKWESERESERERERERERGERERVLTITECVSAKDCSSESTRPPCCGGKKNGAVDRPSWNWKLLRRCLSTTFTFPFPFSEHSTPTPPHTPDLALKVPMYRNKMAYTKHETYICLLVHVVVDHWKLNKILNNISYVPGRWTDEQDDNVGLLWGENSQIQYQLNETYRIKK